jgi:hypothetical protein
MKTCKSQRIKQGTRQNTKYNQQWLYLRTVKHKFMLRATESLVADPFTSNKTLLQEEKEKQLAINRKPGKRAMIHTCPCNGPLVKKWL